MRKACTPIRVAAGAKYASAVTEEVCVSGNRGCRRGHNKLRATVCNEERQLAVEVQEREDRKCSEKQDKSRRPSSIGLESSSVV